MVQEAHKIRTLEELKGHTLEDLLHKVVRSREPITVVIEEGESVTIKLSLQLNPLPELDGRVPEELKDAVYSGCLWTSRPAHMIDFGVACRFQSGSVLC